MFALPPCPACHVASAGHQVATIQARPRDVVIRLYRRGKLRRTFVRRIRAQDVAVLLTRRGELAWFIGRNDYQGQVGLYRGGRVRLLSSAAAIRPALEDGRTLRWSDYTSTYSYFDLRPARCAHSRFAPVVSTDRVAVTRRLYGSGQIVIRACDLAKRRDVVVAQGPSYDAAVDVVGVDRTWVMAAVSAYDRDGSTQTNLEWADVATRATWGPGNALPDDVGPPRAGAFTVTDRGIPAWLDGDRLVRLANYSAPELDHGPGIADLHAEGDAVVWTHDGVRRSAVPVW